MKLVVFGLTISSSWGNGHATLWRGLWKALVRRGHRITFFERDVPYYAQHRDVTSLDGGDLVLYRDWPDVAETARRHLADADAAMVTSYCMDARAATAELLDSARPLKIFYDLDTPVTLDELRGGAAVPYLPAHGLGDFDLVLSYTGGAALDALADLLGARRVAPLYGHVDPESHRRASPTPRYAADLSYLGTYAADRQLALETLFVEPARRLPYRRFSLGGAKYPTEFPWTANTFFVRHLPPAEHPAFFSSSRLTLNITRRAMAEMGYCPSGRLFEATACGTAVLTDCWSGLEEFFTPGLEVLTARTAAEAIAAIEMDDAELARVARAGQQRTLDEHTADCRAEELLRLLAASPEPSPTAAAATAG
jgi:spore maturation protein CgeB